MFRFIKGWQCRQIALSRMAIPFLSQRDIPGQGFIPVFSPAIHNDALYNAGRELSYLAIDAEMKRDSSIILFIDNHYDAKTASILAEMAREHHYGFCVVNMHDEALPSGDRLILYIPTKGWNEEGDVTFNKRFLVKCLTTIMDRDNSFAFVYKASMPLDYYASLKQAHIAVLFEGGKAQHEKMQEMTTSCAIRINTDAKTCSISGDVCLIPYISGRYV